MFYHIRYQTGEINEIISEMKKGNIPSMEVTDSEELAWFLGKLEKTGIYTVDAPYDKNARDRVKEPDFEYRIAFWDKLADAKEVDKKDLMYIDIYFEPEVDETYSPVGEL